ncbi:alpha/beta fold hydrolase [Arthrobacter oryzae]|uniref:alpha/beta fold hydrolase n=1 Tax=Arthrobacter oryzae TaxID=409290 RepID=UPI000EAD3B4E|nr:alpha/beta fold hydrolase [Arthrobacter oryzae]
MIHVEEGVRGLPAELFCQARDGFDLAAQVGGAAGSPALLLLQGQANSHAWWNGVRSAFESEFQTITMDYRGTGSSRGPVAPWTTESFAADAVEILDSAGISTAYVYGTSMGGRVAQMIAAHYPDRVKALVLACTTPGGPNAVDRSREISAELARASAADRLYVLHDLFYTPAWPHPPEDSSLLGDASMTPQELAAHRKASRHHDAWDLLPSITAPTLVLHGEDDLMTPADNARLLADRIPGAGLQIYPGSRHGFFEEFAQQVTPAVLDFFARTPAN